MKYFNVLFMLFVLNNVTATQAETLDYIVAIVNSDVVTYTELQQETRIIESDLKHRNIPIPSFVDLQKQVLDKMILEKLQLQLAQNTGIEIDDTMLNEALRKFAASKGGSLEQLRASLEAEGYSYPKFREEQRDQLIMTRLLQREVVSRISVTDREVDNFLTNQTQQGSGGTEYRLLHILIEIPEAAPSTEIAYKKRQAESVLERLKGGADFRQVAASVSKGRQAFEGGDLGWMSLEQIPTLFTNQVKTMKEGEIVGPIRNDSGFHIIKLAEKRSNTKKSVVTQTKARHILITTNEVISQADAQERLQTLKYRIEQGDDFGELARTNSQDPGSSFKGGDLGWINSGEMVPEFEEVMNSLKPGEVSKPFQSRYGWHLLQVLERRKHDNTEEALRNNARQTIRQRKIEEEILSWQRQLRDEAYVEYRL